MVSISRFAILIFATGILWLFGLRIIWNWLGPRLFRGITPTGFIVKWPAGVRGAIVGVMGLSLVALGWSYVEPYFPVVEHVRIQSPEITSKVRIVHLSDLHSDPTKRAEDKVVALVKEAEPDLIVFTGDGVNSDEGIPVFRETMKELSKIAPVYGVRGNWEVWWFKHVDCFTRTGIRELNGGVETLEIRGQKIAISGVAVESEHLIKKALSRMPGDAYRIFLHHFPAAEERLDGKVDLLLSGDTHGGQVVFPLLGPLIRISRWNDYYYFPGLQRTNGLDLYVNRGIGMEGSGVPRVRFFCAPEVTVIELSGSD